MSSTRTLIERFSEVHPLPQVVTTLNRLIADPESTMKDFEEVISLDQVLVSRLLRLVNSSYYSLLQRVDSISRAVAFLGMKNLHNLAVTDALRRIFTAPADGSERFSRKRLWMHSTAVAICCRMVAERMFSINGDDAFICGVLHDFGLLVEEQGKRKVFHEICRTCTSSSELLLLEQQTFATDHCQIGALLTEDWQMGPEIQQAIRDHHLLAEEITPESLTGILQIAEYLSSQVERGVLPGVEAVIAPPLLAHLQENFEEYAVLLEDMPEEMARAEAIYH